jgi:hypothetical protein
MLFQINPVLILVPVKIIQSIAPSCVYDIIILYLLAAVHRIVRFESEIKSKSSAYNGLGTQNQLPEFTLKTWHGLVDYVTVYAEDDIRFTFKNGQEVKA